MNKGKFLIQLDESKANRSLPICKSSVLQIADDLFNQVLEGKVSAITTAELIKFMEEVAKEVKGKTDETGKYSFVGLVRDEIKAASTNGKDILSRYGTKLELAETGTKYTFDKCEDPLWKYYRDESAKLDKKMKARESFLKTIDPVAHASGMPVGNLLNPDTGELYENVTIYPAIKTSTSSYKQSLLDQ
jgi:hypothetical protein